MSHALNFQDLVIENVRLQAQAAYIRYHWRFTQSQLCFYKYFSTQRRHHSFDVSLYAEISGLMIRRIVMRAHNTSRPTSIADY